MTERGKSPRFVGNTEGRLIGERSWVLGNDPLGFWGAKHWIEGNTGFKRINGCLFGGNNPLGLGEQRVFGEQSIGFLWNKVLSFGKLSTRIWGTIRWVQLSIGFFGCNPLGSGE